MWNPICGQFDSVKNESNIGTLTKKDIQVVPETHITFNCECEEGHAWIKEKLCDGDYVVCEVCGKKYQFKDTGFINLISREVI